MSNGSLHSLIVTIPLWNDTGKNIDVLLCYVITCMTKERLKPTTLTESDLSIQILHKIAGCDRDMKRFGKKQGSDHPWYMQI